jgi:GNAT superfamily N-acetyltransferase
LTVTAIRPAFRPRVSRPSTEMKATIDLFPQGIIDQSFVAKIKQWAGEVTEKTELRAASDHISIYLWEKENDFQKFDAREKAELGIVTGGESDFLATHEAWRGYPRIHISLEKIRGIPEEVVRGVVQHEIAHALLHGKPEFYQFRFTDRLMEAGRSAGLEFPMIQQWVYLLSIAIKDEEVVRLLGKAGLGLYQIRLLEYLMKDTEEERRAWDLIQVHPALRLLGLAAFLKIRLPIETLAGLGLPESGLLQEKWEAAYAWLTDLGEKALNAYVRTIRGTPYNNFQDRLERAVLGLINHSAL